VREFSLRFPSQGRYAGMSGMGSGSPSTDIANTLVPWYIRVIARGVLISSPGWATAGEGRRSCQEVDRPFSDFGTNKGGLRPDGVALVLDISMNKIATTAMPI